MAAKTSRSRRGPTRGSWAKAATVATSATCCQPVLVLLVVAVSRESFLLHQCNNRASIRLVDSSITSGPKGAPANAKLKRLAKVQPKASFIMGDELLCKSGPGTKSWGIVGSMVVVVVRDDDEADA